MFLLVFDKFDKIIDKINIINDTKNPWFCLNILKRCFFTNLNCTWFHKEDLGFLTYYLTDTHIIMNEENYHYYHESKIFFTSLYEMDVQLYFMDTQLLGR